MRKFNIAVVGVTGAVGRTILKVLEERKFPVKNIYPLASAKSTGVEVVFNSKVHKVQDLDTFDFNQVQIALFSPGGIVSKVYAPKAAATGCVVIDNTSEFRYIDDIPLIVPEVNPHAIKNYKNHNIIANPNCSTIQMLVALKPIHDIAEITIINVATYQAVSGTGKAAIDELTQQTIDICYGKTHKVEVYPKQIAFNCLPHIDIFQDNGFTKEEMKMVWETKKIFEDESIIVNPTAVRVPVFYGHSEALHIETKMPISIDEVKRVMSNSSNIILMDNIENLSYPTPAEIAGTNEVYVGRIRKGLAGDNSINLWCVADNVRKGAATNAVQIAEELIRNYL